MNVTARDVMTPRFHTLAPEMPISEAVKRFKAGDRGRGAKNFRNAGHGRERPHARHAFHV